MKSSDWFEFITPMLLLGLFGLGFWGVYRLRGDLTAAPKLTVNNGSLVQTAEEIFVITGNTDRGVSKLLINDRNIKPSQDGSFSASVPLDLGYNNIEVVAYNNKANKSIQKIVVNREQKAAAVMGSTMGPSMTASGPGQNAGILGLSLIITTLIAYINSKRINNKDILALH